MRTRAIGNRRLTIIVAFFVLTGVTLLSNRNVPGQEENAMDAPAAPANAEATASTELPAKEELKVERVPSLLAIYKKSMQDAEKEKKQVPEGEETEAPSFFGLGPLINPNQEMELLLGTAKPPVQKITWSSGTYDKHFDAVTSLSVSFDGSMVLSGSADKSAHLWKLSDKKTIRVFRDDYNHRQGVTDVFLSYDQLYALTASYDSSIRLWNVKSGKNTKSYLGLRDRVWSVSLSPNGLWVAGSADDGTVMFWDALTVKKLGTLSGHAGAIYDVNFSMDSGGLVTAGADGVARVWNVEQLREIKPLAGHTDRVYSAVFSPDSSYVLTASADKTARLWDTNSGKELCRFIGHTGAVRRAIFLNVAAPNTQEAGSTPSRAQSSGPNGMEGRGQTQVSGVIATASDDGTIRIWLPDFEAKDRAAGNQRNAFGPDDQSAMPGMNRNSNRSDSSTGEEEEEDVIPEGERPGSKAKGVELVRFEVGKAVFDLALSPSGLVAACEDGIVRTYAVPNIMASLEKMKTLKDKLEGKLSESDDNNMMMQK
ncbi:MAG: WD40 repeat domain-containing protein [Planctomycetia bacterium]|nr:WD40 repeat domain-containing protein [Planctomycetia bacterium]